MGAEIDHETQIDIVLETFSSSFNQFKINYSMSKLGMTLLGLMNELQSIEHILRKEKMVHFTKASTSKSKRAKGKKKKHPKVAGG